METWLALKMEKRGHEPKNVVLSRSWRGLGNAFFPNHPDSDTALLTPRSVSVRSVSLESDY